MSDVKSIFKVSKEVQQLLIFSSIIFTQTCHTGEGRGGVRVSICHGSTVNILVIKIFTVFRFCAQCHYALTFEGFGEFEERLP